MNGVVEVKRHTVRRVNEQRQIRLIRHKTVHAFHVLRLPNTRAGVFHRDTAHVRVVILRARRYILYRDIRRLSDKTEIFFYIFIAVAAVEAEVHSSKLFFTHAADARGEAVRKVRDILPRLKRQQSHTVFLDCQTHIGDVCVFGAARLFDFRQRNGFAAHDNTLILLLHAQLTAEFVAALFALKRAAQTLVFHSPFAAALCFAAAFFAREMQMLLFDQRAVHVTDIRCFKRDASVKLRVLAVLNERAERILCVNALQHHSGQHAVVERAVVVERTVINGKQLCRFGKPKLLLAVLAKALFHVLL